MKHIEVTCNSLAECYAKLRREMTDERYVSESDCAKRREKLNDNVCGLTVKIERLYGQISFIGKVMAFAGTITAGVLVAILVKLLIG